MPLGGIQHRINSWKAPLQSSPRYPGQHLDMSTTTEASWQQFCLLLPALLCLFVVVVVGTKELFVSVEL